MIRSEGWAHFSEGCRQLSEQEFIFIFQRETGLPFFLAFLLQCRVVTRRCCPEK